jgi:hypothetical protein
MHGRHFRETVPSMSCIAIAASQHCDTNMSSRIAEKNQLFVFYTNIFRKNYAYPEVRASLWQIVFL